MFPFITAHLDACAHLKRVLEFGAKSEPKEKVWEILRLYGGVLPELHWAACMHQRSGEVAVSCTYRMPSKLEKYFEAVWNVEQGKFISAQHNLEYTFSASDLAILNAIKRP